HSRFTLPQPSLHFVEQRRADATTLERRVRRDPVEIVDTISARCRAVTDVADQLSLELPFARERSNELVVRDAVARIVRRASRTGRERLIEQLEGDRHFDVVKDRRRIENLADATAMPPLERPELHLRHHSWPTAKRSSSDRETFSPDRSRA